LARQNYSGEKRRKELEKQKKKEAKRQRKLDNAAAPSSTETSGAGEEQTPTELVLPEQP
jgi:hypothetical protein